MRPEPLDNPRLYEQAALWERQAGAPFMEMKRVVVALASPDVERVLDVGCGDGAITNDLAPGRYVVGCDRSWEALRRLTVHAVRASCDKLPFDDRAFGLVVCTRVLEHLPREVVRRASTEVARVAARYIIVTVPYGECLTLHVTKCAACGLTYNLDGHLRAFADPGDVAACFPGFRTTFVGFCGDLDSRPHRWLIRLRRMVLGDWPTSPTALCPRCGSAEQAASPHMSRFLRYVFDRVQWRTLGPPLHFWMVLKLERIETERASDVA